MAPTNPPPPPGPGPSTSSEQDDTTAPPAYQAVDSNNADKIDNVDITAAFSHLSLASTPGDPTVDTCLAHLKLLYAFQTLKDDVGYTNGLWGIWDSMADALQPGPDDLSAEAAGASTTTPAATTKVSAQEQAKLNLSRLREKRWAIFVARAVDRYQSWWESRSGEPLFDYDMVEGSGSRYHTFVDETKYMSWTEDMLPPLDVLMVWHAHMLNPRSYLEDALRSGLSEFWAAGMPWRVVASAIDTDFTYRVSDQAKVAFCRATCRNWENTAERLTDWESEDIDDSSLKFLKCPACSAVFEVPWTTCGREESSKITYPVSLVGSGFGDGNFSRTCPSCATHIDNKLLSLARFLGDCKKLVVNSVPMPGTVLEPVTGLPKAIPSALALALYSRNLPNRLIKKQLFRETSDLIQKRMTTNPTMETVRARIEQILQDPKALRAINDCTVPRRSMRTGLICLRKMMSRYWDNSRPFALELGGAVMRQGIFTAKMFQIDWLHSPNAHDTMARLITKYKRFIQLMRDDPHATLVPTLDIDLAWHTHQLSPAHYYRYTTALTSKFVDHDDKIDEDALADAFKATTRAYQKKYGDVYSECTCWYCETIRSTSTGSVARALHVSTQDRVSQDFYKSGRAQFCPPDKSAHLSAHNAVRVPSSGNKLVDQLRRHGRERQRRQLELDYAKAQKRAEKNGRTLPPRDEYYNHWGYSYYMYSPFMYPMYFSPGMYYGGGDPGMLGSAGGYGGCAAGSCSAGVAAGACGGPGGCGMTAGGCGAGGGGGGCGGGGGGCGGGGGGCGGGGGGGGKHFMFSICGRASFRCLDLLTCSLGCGGG
ncbi:hypothetical protein BD289DRAFT_368883 [Coniella lustricola]|uniref:Glycine-rich domain-containing protein 1 n=1 Tax=Coniella lustricola TaxID=2025994 RepID=A0A2T3A7A9_9PEZI|nr:hypothetical protein BD289DRAFT_368883 [Coniella lustricola]